MAIIQELPIPQEFITLGDSFRHDNGGNDTPGTSLSGPLRRVVGEVIDTTEKSGVILVRPTKHEHITNDGTIRELPTNAVVVVLASQCIRQTFSW